MALAAIILFDQFPRNMFRGTAQAFASDNLGDQQQSLKLFAELGANFEYAQGHHDVIAKYGRFPHRNAVLDREMREGEQEAVDRGAAW